MALTINVEQERKENYSSRAQAGSTLKVKVVLNEVQYAVKDNKDYNGLGFIKPDNSFII